MTRLQLSSAELAARRAELATIAAARPLAPEEAAERDNLDHQFYMREWRWQHRARWGRKR